MQLENVAFVSAGLGKNIRDVFLIFTRIYNFSECVEATEYYFLLRNNYKSCLHMVSIR